MKSALTDISGIGPNTAALLASHGITSIKKLLKTNVDTLSQVPGFAEFRANAIILAAQALLNDSTLAKAKKETDKKR